MRLTTDRRTGLALLAGALLMVAGCKDRPARGTGNAGSGTDRPESGVQTARQAADAFLKDLGDGKVTPDRLTAQFRKDIGPPTSDEEKKAGFSESAARDWLGRLKGTTFVVGEEATFGIAIVLRGRAEAPNHRAGFALRMVKQGDTYRADWFHLTERMGTGITTPTDPALAAAQDVVRDFLDLLMGGDARQVHALMAPEWRTEKAPPHDPDLRKGLDYDPGYLTQQTRAWGSGLVGYTFGRAELSPARDRATFTVELEADGKKTRATIGAAKKDLATGRWQVVEFSK